MGQSLLIEPTGINDLRDCPCCGRSSRKVWGLISSPERTLACYYVHWTIGQIEEFGANFDLIIGAWGEAASAGDRFAVSLEYRLLESGPAFKAIDAVGRPITESKLFDHALARSDVIGQPIANDVFAYCDLILAQDTRVAELLNGWTLAIT